MKSFFNKEHEGKSYTITYVGFQRVNGKVKGLYTVKGVRKNWNMPRDKIEHLDSLTDEQVLLVLESWQQEVNSKAGSGESFPDFYLEHKIDFLRWLDKSEGVGQTTITHYQSQLGQDVFPFLYGKLKLSPDKWNAKVIQKWEQYLIENNDSAGTRNRKRTAFRRYLRFLKRKGIIETIPQIINEREIRNTKETIIPGKLPSWDDIISFIKSLPKGKFRFINAICAGFGLRFGEAYVLTEDDIFGAESIDEIDASNDHSKRLKDTKMAFLFCSVNKSKKNGISEEISALFGDADQDPKSGNYTACCTNKEMAKLIVSLIDNNEHLEEVSQKDLYLMFDDLLPIENEFKFHEYRFHDWRRVNITLQTLDIKLPDQIQLVCKSHGHSNVSTYSKYYQWALTQLRLKKSKKRKIEVFG